MYREDPDWGAALLEEALALFRKLGDVSGIVTTLHSLGAVAHAQGDDARVAALYREGLAVVREAGFLLNITECLRGLAGVAATGTDPEGAARLLGAEEALRERGGVALPPEEAEPHRRVVAALRGALGEPAFTAAWAAGRALPPEAAVAEALGESADA